VANNGKTLSKNRPKKNSLDQMAKGPIYRHAGNRPAFERTPCVRTRQLSAVERATHSRPQITARAGSVRRGLTGLRSSSALRATASAFERIPCVRMHFWNLLIISCPFLLPRSRRDVRACLLQNTQNKSNY
jgi:hypothetical protein